MSKSIDLASDSLGRVAGVVAVLAAPPRNVGHRGALAFDHLAHARHYSDALSHRLARAPVLAPRRAGFVQAVDDAPMICRRPRRAQRG